MTQNGQVDNTPLSSEEMAGLIPNLATKEELNEWERENMLEARTWAFGERQLRSQDPLTEAYVRELHKRMFDKTWAWAGTYRRTEKNIGVPVHQIVESLARLLGDAQFWIKNKTYSIDESGVRFHLGLAQIHPFPNGNGRHARLIADVLVAKFGGTSLTWGRRDIVSAGPVREAYIEALHAADNGDIQPLLTFSSS